MTNIHQRLTTLLLAASLTGFSASLASADTMTKNLQASFTPEQALQKLKEGNQRFVSGKIKNRDLRKQVKDTAKGQYPFATVVSCLDSRTSTELIFDQGIGDVFNARIAGNIVNADILGSLEFASKAAGSKLVAVIGHTKCGAIKGACDGVELGNLTGLLNKMKPAVAATKSATGEDRSSNNDAFVDRVAETNVRQTMDAIRKDSPTLLEMEKAGQVKIVGAMYHLDSGKVTFLE